MIVILLAFVWPLAILWCAALIVARLASRPYASKASKRKGVAVPAVLLLLLTAPLWYEALALEVLCRRTGLIVTEPRAQAREGLYWNSHRSDSSTNTRGVPAGNGRLHKEFTIGTLRALAEGRIAYLEVPFTPANGQAAATNQKLSLARKGSGTVECLDAGRANLPGDLCIAWESTDILDTRYEVRGTMGDDAIEHGVLIRDRKDGREIARHRFVRSVRASQTVLRYWGIHSLQPVACDISMTDAAPAANLVAIAFSGPEVPSVQPGTVGEYAKSAWNVRPPEPPALEVPRASEGIEFWIARGQLRSLTRADLGLWNSARGSGHPHPAYEVPYRSYLVTGEIVLPADMYGAHSATWVLPKGKRIPPGPRGHSQFFEVGRGCVWAAGGCEHAK